MGTIVLKKESISERIPISAKKTIKLISRKGVHYRFDMHNSSTTQKLSYHISESTLFDLEKISPPIEIDFIQFKSFGQKCIIEYETE